MSDGNNNSSATLGYEKKLAKFIELCDATERDGLFVIARPQALGDTYEEIVESLNRLSDAELRLLIVPRSMRETVTK